MKTETLERLYDAITAGRISRDNATYGYVDSDGLIRNPDLALYELEDKGYVRLHLDGGIEQLPKGEAWRNRPRKPGPAAAQFSDQPGAAA
ncbi:hypothetical protein [Micromonospora profundi]|uniref:hypothetical protein n=1 Tax=Micromonospora profundi TaxID=1420889 RepID=UPI0036690A8D